MTICFQHTTFLKSAFKAADFPTCSKIEIAFAGRSNVGKSSTLNILAGTRKLAKVSKTPGRTTSINFFAFAPDAYLVDLPGYGYAKVAQSVKAHWQVFLREYILTRESLHGIILIMDCRHPFTMLDQFFLQLCETRNLPCHILLNKADKLSNNEKSRLVQKEVKPYLLQNEQLSWQFFSALRGEGLEVIKAKILSWNNKENSSI